MKVKPCDMCVKDANDSLGADVRAVVAENQEQRVQDFWQVLYKDSVRHLVHGLDPAQVESPREGVLAVHFLLKDRNKRVQVELVAFSHNVLLERS